MTLAAVARPNPGYGAQMEGDEPGVTAGEATRDDAREDVAVLHGGVANAGAVVRVGGHVVRPSNAHTGTIHDLLRHLHDSGFHGASRPVGVDPDGRERLVFIPGEVPVIPYPAWSQSDESLASVARLLRRYHDAASGYVPPVGATWSDEMIDHGVPMVGDGADQIVVCHNDVCLENVVFRDGIAVALLDFDFAAPGRRQFDLANFARMCVPIDDETSVRFGWRPADQGERLRIVADAYGLTAPERETFFTILAGTIAAGGAFLRRRAAAGDPNFVAMWQSTGGEARFDHRRQWFEQHAARFRAALG
ncbi:MAG: hypothetical protein JWM12_2031 [Ilumatobacteraceae bacterium]|nr:hypothetical protein [Ilumatobacteraceae bacterium]